MRNPPTRRHWSSAHHLVSGGLVPGFSGNRGASKSPATPAAPSAVPSIPEKSIAVLPFENLSANQETAFFTDGVQDEILSDLAKVADLKVISRTSVMQYKTVRARNLREIGRQLGVAHVVEGSVQRAGNRVRVNAQLIDARTDAHLWAQTYDRDLADVFAIQSEIAQTIADQLQARMSPREKAAIAQPPTTDPVAQRLYAQALQLSELASNPDGKEALLQAITLLDEALARDPHFLDAYGLLSAAHIDLYWQGFDHTAARLELARATIERAAAINPDAGDVHLMQANYAYKAFRDYDRARAELELARKTLPNNAVVYVLTASIDRRQGRWSESTQNLERSVSLDPRNFRYLVETAFTYQALRRFDRVGPHVRAGPLRYSHGSLCPCATRSNPILRTRRCPVVAHQTFRDNQRRPEGSYRDREWPFLLCTGRAGFRVGHSCAPIHPRRGIA